jgi:hypothetical protein
MRRDHSVVGGAAQRDTSVPVTTLNVIVIDPVERPANSTRPLHAATVENGALDHELDTTAKEAASTPPAFVRSLPTLIKRLSQLVIPTIIV